MKTITLLLEEIEQLKEKGYSEEECTDMITEWVSERISHTSYKIPPVKAVFFKGVHSMLMGVIMTNISIDNKEALDAWNEILKCKTPDDFLTRCKEGI